MCFYTTLFNVVNILSIIEQYLSCMSLFFIAVEYHAINLFVTLQIIYLLCNSTLQPKTFVIV